MASAITCGATAYGDDLDSDSGLGPVAWEIGPFTDYPFAQGGLIKPDLCAPGNGVESCNAELSPLHIPFDGTSASAAQIAGCAALLVEANLRSPNPVTPSWIQEALEEGAEKFLGQAPGSKSNNVGAGKARVFQAFQYGIGKGWWAAPPPPPNLLVQRDQVGLTAFADKLSPALQALLLIRAAQQGDIHLTVTLQEGLAEAAIQTLLNFLGPLGTNVEFLQRLGFVLFTGPLNAVRTIAARAEVIWIDLESETGIGELLDLL